MIVGVGVDILGISRIKALLTRKPQAMARFSRRILSKQELIQFNSDITEKDHQISYLATRWCLKEAVYKAVYPRQILHWKDVTITKTGPKPTMEVKWNLELAGSIAHISISHDQGLLFGYVTVEKVY